MSEPWPIQLVVDAAGRDDVRVHPAGCDRDSSAHLMVVVGSLIVRCLDGRAVQDHANAWARALVITDEALPLTVDRPASRLRTARGYGYACGEVLTEGPQRWQVRAPLPGKPFAVVGTDSLLVRVHDRAALRVHVQAWSLAADLAQTVMRTPPVPFNRLLDTERRRWMDARYQADQVRTDRSRSRGSR